MVLAHQIKGLASEFFTDVSSSYVQPQFMGLLALEGGIYINRATYIWNCGKVPRLWALLGSVL